MLSAEVRVPNVTLVTSGGQGGISFKRAKILGNYLRYRGGHRMVRGSDTVPSRVIRWKGVSW